MSAGQAAMDYETVGLLLANRGFLYAVAARAFAEEPDGAFARVLSGGHVRDEAVLVDSPETDAIVARLELMTEILAEPGGAARAAREYVRLFVGPGTLAADPWETVQLTGVRALFQPGVLEVRTAYRAAGFEPARVREVPDDFIGVELDFVARLAARAQSAHAAGDPAWREDLGRSQAFLEGHLLRWTGKLAASVEAEGGGFYAHACRFVDLVGRRDLVVIRELMKTVDHSLASIS